MSIIPASSRSGEEDDTGGRRLPNEAIMNSALFSESTKIIFISYTFMLISCKTLLTIFFYEVDILKDRLRLRLCTDENVFY